MILMPKDFEACYQGVLDAVKDGTLPDERFEQYHSLHREAAALERRNDPVAQKRSGKQFGKMIREANAARRDKGDTR